MEVCWLEDWRFLLIQLYKMLVEIWTKQCFERRKVYICHDPFIQFPLCFISWIDFWRIEQMPVLLFSDAVLVCIHLLEFSNNFLPMTYYDFVFLIKAVFNIQATYNRQAEKVVTADTASESLWSSSCISWIRLYEFAILALDSNRCTMKPCLYSLSCRHILQRLKNILYFNIIFSQYDIIKYWGGKINKAWRR